jgi:hypothetical protein
MRGRAFWTSIVVAGVCGGLYGWISGSLNLDFWPSILLACVLVGGPVAIAGYVLERRPGRPGAAERAPLQLGLPEVSSIQ